jgi:hypothetical protein
MKKLWFLFFLLGVLNSPWKGNSADQQRIEDLRLTGVLGRNLGFNWTEPAGVTNYDVRLSTNGPINEMNRRGKTQLDYLKTPGTPGVKHYVILTGLSPNSTNYVAIWAQGTNGISSMSNLERGIIGNESNSTICLAWNPPTNCVNGSPLTELAGYKIYLGSSAGVYTRTVDVRNVTSCTLSGIDFSITNIFVATCYDTYGDESDKSEELVVAPISLSP